MLLYLQRPPDRLLILSRSVPLFDADAVAEKLTH